VTADPQSFNPAAIATFNGYSPSGEAEAQVVYANYGREEDFAELEQTGIEIRGKIVIARYGKLFRANKVRLAEERGAVGMLLYSDPADDGYTVGPVRAIKLFEEKAK
jgi:N-acetylated-alpha-linked acidic dipeptidase